MIIISLLEQCFIHIPLLLGAYISFYLLKKPDLSIESAFTFGGFCTSLIIPHIGTMHCSIQLTIVISISILAGSIIGLLSSTLTCWLKISHLLSTIMATGIVYGINQLIVGSYYSISAYNNPLSVPILYGHPEFLMLSIISLITFLLVYLLLRTEIGLCVTAYGINSDFFKHYNISSIYIFILGTVIANGLAGLSGYLHAQSSGFVDITMALNKSLLCLTALIFGKVVVHTTAIVHLGHPVIGGLVYFVVQYGLIFIGFDSKLFTLMQALTICLLLAVRTHDIEKNQQNILGI